MELRSSDTNRFVRIPSDVSLRRSFAGDFIDAADAPPADFAETCFTGTIEVGVDGNGAIDSGNDLFWRPRRGFRAGFSGGPGVFDFSDWYEGSLY